jgi:ATP-dependent Clp protease ATP-binding subunit ClpC
MFERYTEQARRVLFFARYEASQLGSRSLAPEHLLLGLLRDTPNTASPLLKRLPADTGAAIAPRIATAERIPASVEIPFAGPAKRALETAAAEADRLGDAHIGPEHLLLALASDPTTIAGEMLSASGLTLDALRADLADGSEGARGSE